MHCTALSCTVHMRVQHDRMIVQWTERATDPVLGMEPQGPAAKQRIHTGLEDTDWPKGHRQALRTQTGLKDTDRP